MQGGIFSPLWKNNKIKHVFYDGGGKMKVYVAVALYKENVPKILGVFKDKNKAEEIAYGIKDAWGNVIEKELE